MLAYMLYIFKIGGIKELNLKKKKTYLNIMQKSPKIARALRHVQGDPEYMILLLYFIKLRNSRTSA